MTRSWSCLCCFLAAFVVLALGDSIEESAVDNEQQHNMVLQPRSKPSFVVDYENGRFLLDGSPFRYISGSVHYFRIHPSQWLDRLKRVRALGFNAIQFYVPWNFHEVERGKHDFSGWRDFPRFIKLAAEQGLFTLLRLGPYSCGEWENGGLPYWLIVDRPQIKQRSNDSVFTAEVARWFSILLPVVKPLLRQNGGPVLMVQIENEYGSYDACDHDYISWLRDLTLRQLGKDTVIYTTDGGSEGYLKCGAVNGTLSTIDFGPTSKLNVYKAFEAQRKYLPGGKGPFVNSEYYPGWLVLWGQRTQDLPSLTSVLATSRFMYDAGASINFYMIYGGTNYGFWNGAETNGPVITSYDYSAPISEGGNYTAAYFGLRAWIKTLPAWQNPPLTPPEPPVAKAYGAVKMTWRPPQELNKLACTASTTPLSFEQIGQQFGYVLFYTELDRCGTNLTIETLKDFGYVFFREKPQGVMIKMFGKVHVNSVQLDPELCLPGARLEILVENQGRQTYETINDYKGILSPVLLDGVPLEGWTQCTIAMPFELNEEKEKEEEKREKPHLHVRKQEKTSKTKPLGFFHGVFNLDGEPSDTYIQMRGWGKGHVEVNGHNVGRFWSSQGPQYTLYVPAALLVSGKNQISLLELEGATSEVCSDTQTCKLTLVDQPDIHFDKGIRFVDYHKIDKNLPWKTRRDQERAAAAVEH